jgi:hypothetical protein
MTDRHAQHGAFCDDFKELEVGPWRVVVSDQFTDGFRLLADAVNFAQCSSAEALGMSDTKSVGRAHNTIIQLPGHDVRFQLRPLCHGGVLAPITGKRFAGLDRPLQELRVTARLLKRGAPVAVPAFVVGRRTPPFTLKALVTAQPSSIPIRISTRSNAPRELRVSQFETFTSLVAGTLTFTSRTF